MLERELPLERALFYMLNGSDSPTMDHFMWLYSGKWTWLLFYLCIFVVVIYKYKNNWKEYVFLFLMIAILITLCDQIASGIFKPFFERLRPTYHPDFKDQVEIVSGYRGGRYGFISSHATNVFGFATFTALLFRHRIYTVVLFIHALITIYSRVYLGVHFISDVLAGALVGVITGFLVYKLYIYIRRQYISTNDQKPDHPVYSKKEIFAICSSYILTVILILLFNNLLIKKIN